MLKKKYDIITFIRCKEALELSELIAIRIEQTSEYYIYKCKYYDSNVTVSETVFKQLLSRSIRPIVLSDMYIEINSHKN